jgi:hypothetical protein
VGGRPVAEVLQRGLCPGAERGARMAGGVFVFDGSREGFEVD